MTGYTYGDAEPTETCPYCGANCRADFVDIGVGYTQCGPFHCEECGASEIGAFDKPRELTAEEQKTRWYSPGAEPGTSANVIGGKVVSHHAMKDAYQSAFIGNPLWEDGDYVEEWWRRTREAKS